MSSIFGGGSKQQAPTQIVSPQVADTGQDNAKRKIGRASLYLTSPQGDLNPASTTSGKLFGN